MSEYHIPVLLQEVCTYLDIQVGNKYIDATLGGGGHASAIISQGGSVLGLDQDPDALSACPDLENLVKAKSNFIHLQEVASKTSWFPVVGIIFDLGLSTHQIQTPGRGFSFQSEGPLDMRMDPDTSVTATDLINALNASDLERLLRMYGDVRDAKRISQRIISMRPIMTTTQLAELLGAGDVRRQVFQALRIAINDELGAVETALPQALSLLSPMGKILVITFHSLEDGLVKKTFQAWESQKLGTVLTPKPVTPTVAEINSNPKSKSAKLRVFQKI